MGRKSTVITCKTDTKNRNPRLMTGRRRRRSRRRRRRRTEVEEEEERMNE